MNTPPSRQQVLDAAARMEQAVAARPDAAAVRADLAQAYRMLGRLPEALAQYQWIADRYPDSADARCNLATTLGALGREEEARTQFRRVLASDPGHAMANYNLGVGLQQQGRFEEAAEALRRAVARAPAFAVAHNNLGSVLRELGRPEQALESYRRAIGLAPDDPRYRNNLALALQDLCRLDEAMASFDAALRLRPDYTKAKAFRALALLLRGDYARGWADYEARREIDVEFPDRSAGRPKWDGSDPRGKTILLHNEQGIGDTIQFVRYAPLVASRGARVVVQCQPPLKALLEASLVPRGVWRVIAEGEPVGDFDVFCPLPGLPHLFGTRVESVPAAVPYLDAPADRVAAWRHRFSHDQTFKVGIVWAGAAGNRNDRRRSVRATDFFPLSQVPGVALYSLQKGPPLAQLGEFAPGLPAHELDEHLNDFADTAAAVTNLDLVVTVDTSVAHLAGALGRPVWTLLPFAPDFRWMLNRADTPWYPTMRLFRQAKPGDWPAVFEEVTEALRAAVAAGAAGPTSSAT